MINQHVSVFTIEEDLVLSDWVGTRPVEKIPPGLTVDEAMERLGYTEEAHNYRLEDAVVAGIVLERIQQRLPQWAAVDPDKPEGQRMRFAREYKDRTARRTVELNPRHLLTVNWADSGPGFSWPVAYYATWVPIYERYIVTASVTATSQSGTLGLPTTLPAKQEKWSRAIGHGNTASENKPSGHICSKRVS